MKIMLLAHYDFIDNRGSISKLLPINDIIDYAIKNNMWIVEVYNNKSITQYDSIIDRDVCNWFNAAYPEPLQSKMFENCEIILTGGYRSLCFKHFYNCLSLNNNVIINPVWVVSDPDYINNDIFPFWEYPENKTIDAEQLKGGH